MDNEHPIDLGDLVKDLTDDEVCALADDLALMVARIKSNEKKKD